MYGRSIHAGACSRHLIGALVLQRPETEGAHADRMRPDSPNPEGSYFFSINVPVLNGSKVGL